MSMLEGIYPSGKGLPGRLPRYKQIESRVSVSPEIVPQTVNTPKAILKIECVWGYEINPSTKLFKKIYVKYAQNSILKWILYNCRDEILLSAFITSLKNLESKICKGVEYPNKICKIVSVNGDFNNLVAFDRDDIEFLISDTCTDALQEMRDNCVKAIDKSRTFY